MLNDPNDHSWSFVLNDMFKVPSRECTPAAILDTMHALTDMKARKHERKRVRKALSLDDITHHAKIRNITCTDAEVLSCLRTLYREKRIRHRSIGGNHRFLVETL